jgi:hypothetical protein
MARIIKHIIFWSLLIVLLSIGVLAFFVREGVEIGGAQIDEMKITNKTLDVEKNIMVRCFHIGNHANCVILSHLYSRKGWDDDDYQTIDF